VPNDKDFIHKSLAAFRPKMETLNDALELYLPLDDHSFTIHEDAKEVLNWPTSQKVFEVWKSLLEERGDKALTEEDFDLAVNQVKDQAEVKGKHLFMPIRVAIIGKPHGPELKTLIPLLHLKSLLKRVEMVLSHTQ